MIYNNINDIISYRGEKKRPLGKKILKEETAAEKKHCIKFPDNIKFIKKAV